jgi:hypothetical protein
MLYKGAERAGCRESAGVLVFSARVAQVLSVSRCEADGSYNANVQRTPKGGSVASMVARINSVKFFVSRPVPGIYLRLPFPSEWITRGSRADRFGRFHARSLSFFR